MRGNVGRNRELRAVILRGAGKAFCCGQDLFQMTGRDINDYRRIFDVCTDLMTKIQQIPQLVSAELHATAMAADCQLVVSCDLAVTSEEAAFATPGVKIGLLLHDPDGGADARDRPQARVCRCS